MIETDEQPTAGQAKDPPILGLISDALRQFWRLVRGEFDLLRAETAQIVARVVIGLLLALLAVILVMIALTQLAASLAAGAVALGLAPVWAHLAAAAVLLFIAGFVAWLAWRRLRFAALAPARTLRNLQQDAEIIRPRWSKKGVSQ